MTDIYEILKSKPHNPHYLNRYYKFIYGCQEKNKGQTGYFESHHICPKASDLFPEYQDFKINQWNCVSLTARQHIIAHILLWKCYGKSQTMAAHCMIDNFNNKNNRTSLFLREIPKSIEIRYLAILREEAAKERGKYTKGKSTYTNGFENFFLDTNDPLIIQENLIHIKTGTIHKEESKQKMSDAKQKYKKIKLFKELETIKVLENDQELIQQKLLEGYTLKPDTLLRKKIGYSNVSQKMKGRCQYYYPDGTHFGMLFSGDSIIQELGLLPFNEKNKELALKNCFKNHKDPKVQAKKKEKMSQKTWFYHPETNDTKRLSPLDVIPEGYQKGRPGSWFHDPLSNQKGLFIRGKEPLGWLRGKINKEKNNS